MPIRLRIRSQLIMLLAIPLVALIALSALGVRIQAQEVDRLENLESDSKTVFQVDDLIDDIEFETSLKLAWVDGGSAEAVTAARQATDAQIEIVRPLLEQSVAAGRASARQAEILLVELTQVNAIRSAIDVSIENGGIANLSVFDSFNPIETAARELATTLVLGIEDVELAAAAQEVVALAQLKQIDSIEVRLLGQYVLFPTVPLGRQVTSVQGEREAWKETFDSAATPFNRDVLSDILDSQEGTALDFQRTQILENFSSVEGSDLLSTARTRFQALEDFSNLAQSRYIKEIENRASSAQRQSQVLIATMAGLFAGVAILVVLVARRIVRPVRQLTDAAHDVATEQLPKLLDAISKPGAETAAALAPIEVQGSTEIAELTEAFNAVQDAAQSVANEQGDLLRKGVSSLFVNLARRNQALIDEQLDLLDDLEGSTEEEEQLADLFRLDHLATRMRRNAESLLVLAGSEQRRRWSEPVPMVDMLRASVSEVADMTRFEIEAIDDIDVVGRAISDIAHLVAELLDNAANFSPPETQVSIGCHAQGSSYVVTVRDRGIGMADAAMNEANSLLAEPPVSGLVLSRSLGFVVCGQIAKRYDLNVSLGHCQEHGGIVASVEIPSALLVQPDGSPYMPEIVEVEEAPVVDEIASLDEIAQMGAIETDLADQPTESAEAHESADAAGFAETDELVDASDDVQATQAERDEFDSIVETLLDDDIAQPIAAAEAELSAQYADDYEVSYDEDGKLISPPGSWPAPEPESLHLESEADVVITGEVGLDLGALPQREPQTSFTTDSKEPVLAETKEPVVAETKEPTLAETKEPVSALATALDALPQREPQTTFTSGTTESAPADDTIATAESMPERKTKKRGQAAGGYWEARRKVRDADQSETGEEG